jgi:hypothetical protein
MMRRICVTAAAVALLAVLVAVTVVFAAVPRSGSIPPVRPLPQRFAALHTAGEVPDFRRHVIPMMGRMGCNSRACHGSFQGQGGFRLSLFGYDFPADHQALTGGAEPRADVHNPLDSLVLNHPTEADHGGGQRFTRGSWQYNVLRRWIEGGARGTSAAAAQLTRLEIQPAEIVFRQPGEKLRLSVAAVWGDGSREDVSDISRFRSNDESIAEVNDEGLVTARGKGDTHVVAFYDRAVVPIPVMMPVSDLVGEKYPRVEAATPVDRLVTEKLRKLGIVPSGLADDAQFLRRVSLDLTGTLPTPDEIRAFLAERAADKRARKIDELLASPAYAAWWATKFCDWTGNSPQQLVEQTFRPERSRQWYDWLYRRVAENVPYDRIVSGLLLAVSRSAPEQSYRDYCRETTCYFRKPAAADFSGRETMPYYWTRRNMQLPEDRAVSVSYAFLGVRIQCAQCHKHPFDQWTQQDFRQFQAFFEPLRYGVKPQDSAERREMLDALGVTKGIGQKALIEKSREAVDKGQTLPWNELFVAAGPGGGKAEKKNKLNKNPRPGPPLTPKLLGAEEVPAARYADPRVALMEWMRRPDNPYFARAIVNRVWANYFGSGIVNPPDDLNMANPPSNGPLLDYLSDGFVGSGFDLKWLHRTILNSQTYQRTWEPNATNRGDERNFSRMVPRRLPAEVAYDAILQAVAAPGRLATIRTDMSGRAIGGAVDFKNNFALTTLGKPARQVTCDCERSNDPSLLQTVMLRNDPAVLRQIDGSPWLRQVAQADDPPAKSGRKAVASKLPPPQRVERLVREVFLRTVSRPPTAAELSDAKQLVGTRRPSAGLRELLWTMLNTKEFIVNH